MSISISTCSADEMADAMENIAAVLRCPVKESAIGFLRHEFYAEDKEKSTKACRIEETMSAIADIHIPYVSPRSIAEARLFARAHGRPPANSTVWDYDKNNEPEDE